MLDAIYTNTVRLLLNVIPDVFVDDYFAINGGTAINLFAREAPRLSVDIDLVYLKGAESREVALVTIAAALQNIAHRLRARGLRAKPVRVGGDPESKLLIMEAHGGLTLKIEVNTVFRAPSCRSRRVNLYRRRWFGNLAFKSTPLFLTTMNSTPASWLRYWIDSTHVTCLMSGCCTNTAA